MLFICNIVFSKKEAISPYVYKKHLDLKKTAIKICENKNQFFYLGQNKANRLALPGIEKI